jgi:hypothetical protein
LVKVRRDHNFIIDKITQPCEIPSMQQREDREEVAQANFNGCRLNRTLVLGLFIEFQCGIHGRILMAWR